MRHPKSQKTKKPLPSNYSSHTDNPKKNKRRNSTSTPLLTSQERPIVNLISNSSPNSTKFAKSSEIRTSSTPFHATTPSHAKPSSFVLDDNHSIPTDGKFDKLQDDLSTFQDSFLTKKNQTKQTKHAKQTKQTNQTNPINATKFLNNNRNRQHDNFEEEDNNTVHIKPIINNSPKKMIHNDNDEDDYIVMEEPNAVKHKNQNKTPIQNNFSRPNQISTQSEKPNSDAPNSDQKYTFKPRSFEERATNQKAYMDQIKSQHETYLETNTYGHDISVGYKTDLISLHQQKVREQRLYRWENIAEKLNPKSNRQILQRTASDFETRIHRLKNPTQEADLYDIRGLHGNNNLFDQDYDHNESNQDQIDRLDDPFSKQESNDGNFGDLTTEFFTNFDSQNDPNIYSEDSAHEHDLSPSSSPPSPSPSPSPLPKSSLLSHSSIAWTFRHKNHYAEARLQRDILKKADKSWIEQDLFQGQLSQGVEHSFNPTELKRQLRRLCISPIERYKLDIEHIGEHIQAHEWIDATNVIFDASADLCLTQNHYIHYLEMMRDAAKQLQSSSTWALHNSRMVDALGKVIFRLISFALVNKAVDFDEPLEDENNDGKHDEQDAQMKHIHPVDRLGTSYNNAHKNETLSQLIDKPYDAKFNIAAQYTNQLTQPNTQTQSNSDPKKSKNLRKDFQPLSTSLHPLNKPLPAAKYTPPTRVIPDGELHPIVTQSLGGKVLETHPKKDSFLAFPTGDLTSELITQVSQTLYALQAPGLLAQFNAALIAGYCSKMLDWKAQVLPDLLERAKNLKSLSKRDIDVFNIQCDVIIELETFVRDLINFTRRENVLTDLNRISDHIDSSHFEQSLFSPEQHRAIEIINSSRQSLLQGPDVTDIAYQGSQHRRNFVETMTKVQGDKSAEKFPLEPTSPNYVRFASPAAEQLALNPLIEDSNPIYNSGPPYSMPLPPDQNHANKTIGGFEGVSGIGDRVQPVVAAYVRRIHDDGDLEDLNVTTYKRPNTKPPLLPHSKAFLKDYVHNMIDLTTRVEAFVANQNKNDKYYSFFLIAQHFVPGITSIPSRTLQSVYNDWDRTISPLDPLWGALPFNLLTMVPNETQLQTQVLASLSYKHVAMQSSRDQREVLALLNNNPDELMKRDHITGRSTLDQAMTKNSNNNTQNNNDPSNNHNSTTQTQNIRKNNSIENVENSLDLDSQIAHISLEHAKQRDTEAFVHQLGLAWYNQLHFNKMKTSAVVENSLLLHHAKKTSLYTSFSPSTTFSPSFVTPTAIHTSVNSAIHSPYPSIVPTMPSIPLSTLILNLNSHCLDARNSLDALIQIAKNNHLSNPHNDIITHHEGLLPPSLSPIHISRYIHTLTKSILPLSYLDTYYGNDQIKQLIGQEALASRIDHLYDVIDQVHPEYQLPHVQVAQAENLGLKQGSYLGLHHWPFKHRTHRFKDSSGVCIDDEGADHSLLGLTRSSMSTRNDRQYESLSPYNQPRLADRPRFLSLENYLDACVFDSPEDKARKLYLKHRNKTILVGILTSFCVLLDSEQEYASISRQQANLSQKSEPEEGKPSQKKPQSVQNKQTNALYDDTGQLKQDLDDIDHDTDDLSHDIDPTTSSNIRKKIKKNSQKNNILLYQPLASTPHLSTALLNNLIEALLRCDQPALAYALLDHQGKNKDLNTQEWMNWLRGELSAMILQAQEQQISSINNLNNPDMSPDVPLQIIPPGSFWPKNTKFGTNDIETARKDENNADENPPPDTASNISPSVPVNETRLQSLPSDHYRHQDTIAPLSTSQIVASSSTRYRTPHTDPQTGRQLSIWDPSSRTNPYTSHLRRIQNVSPGLPALKSSLRNEAGFHLIKAQLLFDSHSQTTYGMQRYVGNINKATQEDVEAASPLLTFVPMGFLKVLLKPSYNKIPLESKIVGDEKMDETVGGYNNLDKIDGTPKDSDEVNPDLLNSHFYAEDILDDDCDNYGEVSAAQKAKRVAQKLRTTPQTPSSLLPRRKSTKPLFLRANITTYELLLGYAASSQDISLSLRTHELLHLSPLFKQLHSSTTLFNFSTQGGSGPSSQDSFDGIKRPSLYQHAEFLLTPLRLVNFSANAILSILRLPLSSHYSFHMPDNIGPMADMLKQRYPGRYPELFDAKENVLTRVTGFGDNPLGSIFQNQTPTQFHNHENNPSQKNINLDLIFQNNDPNNTPEFNFEKLFVRPIPHDNASSLDPSLASSLPVPSTFNPTSLSDHMALLFQAYDILITANPFSRPNTRNVVTPTLQLAMASLCACLGDIQGLVRVFNHIEYSKSFVYCSSWMPHLLVHAYTQHLHNLRLKKELDEYVDVVQNGKKQPPNGKKTIEYNAVHHEYFNIVKTYQNNLNFLSNELFAQINLLRGCSTDPNWQLACVSDYYHLDHYDSIKDTSAIDNSNVGKKMQFLNKFSKLQNPSQIITPEKPPPKKAMLYQANVSLNALNYKPRPYPKSVNDVGSKWRDVEARRGIPVEKKNLFLSRVKNSFEVSLNSNTFHAHNNSSSFSTTVNNILTNAENLFQYFSTISSSTRATLPTLPPTLSSMMDKVGSDKSNALSQSFYQSSSFHHGFDPNPTSSIRSSLTRLQKRFGLKNTSWQQLTLQLSKGNGELKKALFGLITQRREELLDETKMSKNRQNARSELLLEQEVLDMAPLDNNNGVSFEFPLVNNGDEESSTNNSNSNNTQSGQNVKKEHDSYAEMNAYDIADDDDFYYGVDTELANYSTNFETIAKIEYNAEHADNKNQPPRADTTHQAPEMASQISSSVTNSALQTEQLQDTLPYQHTTSTWSQSRLQTFSVHVQNSAAQFVIPALFQVIYNPRVPKASEGLFSDSLPNKTSKVWMTTRFEKSGEFRRTLQHLLQRKHDFLQNIRAFTAQFYYYGLSPLLGLNRNPYMTSAAIGIRNLLGSTDMREQAVDKLVLNAYPGRKSKNQNNDQNDGKNHDNDHLEIIKTCFSDLTHLYSVTLQHFSLHYRHKAKPVNTLSSLIHLKAPGFQQELLTKLVWLAAPSLSFGENLSKKRPVFDIFQSVSGPVPQPLSLKTRAVNPSMTSKDLSGAILARYYVNHGDVSTSIPPNSNMHHHHQHHQHQQHQHAKQLKSNIDDMYNLELFADLKPSTEKTHEYQRTEYEIKRENEFIGADFVSNSAALTFFSKQLSRAENSGHFFSTIDLTTGDGGFKPTSILAEMRRFIHLEREETRKLYLRFGDILPPFQPEMLMVEHYNLFKTKNSMHIYRPLLPTLFNLEPGEELPVMHRFVTQPQVFTRAYKNFIEQRVPGLAVFGNKELLDVVETTKKRLDETLNFTQNESNFGGKRKFNRPTLPSGPQTEANCINPSLLQSEIESLGLNIRAGKAIDVGMIVNTASIYAFFGDFSSMIRVLGRLYFNSNDILIPNLKPPNLGNTAPQFQPVLPSQDLVIGATQKSTHIVKNSPNTPPPPIVIATKTGQAHRKQNNNELLVEYERLPFKTNDYTDLLQKISIHSHFSGFLSALPSILTSTYLNSQNNEGEHFNTEHNSTVVNNEYNNIHNLKFKLIPQIEKDQTNMESFMQKYNSTIKTASISDPELKNDGIDLLPTQRIQLDLLEHVSSRLFKEAEYYINTHLNLEYQYQYNNYYYLSTTPDLPHGNDILHKLFPNGAPVLQTVDLAPNYSDFIASLRHYSEFVVRQHAEIVLEKELQAARDHIHSTPTGANIEGDLLSVMSYEALLKEKQRVLKHNGVIFSSGENTRFSGLIDDPNLPKVEKKRRLALVREQFIIDQQYKDQNDLTYDLSLFLANSLSTLFSHYNLTNPFSAPQHVGENGTPPPQLNKHDPNRLEQVTLYYSNNNNGNSLIPLIALVLLRMTTLRESLCADADTVIAHQSSPHSERYPNPHEPRFDPNGTQNDVLNFDQHVSKFEKRVPKNFEKPRKNKFNIYHEMDNVEFMSKFGIGVGAITGTISDQLTSHQSSSSPSNQPITYQQISHTDAFSHHRPPTRRELARSNQETSQSNQQMRSDGENLRAKAILRGDRTAVLKRNLVASLRRGVVQKEDLDTLQRFVYTIAAKREDF